MKKNLLIVLILSLISFQGYSQFSLMGEVNARPEYRNGFKAPLPQDADPAFFTEQRTRLYANYKAEKYEVQVTLQDVRIWGANGQIYKADNGMTALSEGWGRYYVAPKFSVKAGRQIIAYDNDRFFGNLEWAMQGRRHDALLFMYEDDSAKFKVHAGLAFNQSATVPEPVKLVGTSYPPGPNGAYHAVGNYKDMEYLWATKQFDGASLSLYLVNEGRQYGVTQDSTSYRQTYGLMGMKKFGKLQLDGEFFYQGGKIGTADLSAMLYSVSATLSTDVTPITIGYDFVSGNDPNDATVGSFAPAFGTNHKFYGFMDYFYVGNPNNSTGVQDIYLKTKFKLLKGALLGHVHYFLTATDTYETDGSVASAGLGTEIDLVYVKKLAPEITWKIGYSQMFGTDTMSLIKPGNGDATEVNNWAWTQIIFKPKFL